MHTDRNTHMHARTCGGQNKLSEFQVQHPSTEAITHPICSSTTLPPTTAPSSPTTKATPRYSKDSLVSDRARDDDPCTDAADATWLDGGGWKRLSFPHFPHPLPTSLSKPVKRATSGIHLHAQHAREVREWPHGKQTKKEFALRSLVSHRTTEATPTLDALASLSFVHSHQSKGMCVCMWERQ